MGRMRWVAVFALLLFSCGAVPVLAADEVPVPAEDRADFTPRTSQEEEIAAAQVPDAASRIG